MPHPPPDPNQPSATNYARIAAAFATIDDHEGRIDNVEGIATSHAQRLTAAESYLTSLNTGVTGHTQQLTAQAGGLAEARLILDEIGAESETARATADAARRDAALAAAQQRFRPGLNPVAFTRSLAGGPAIGRPPLTDADLGMTARGASAVIRGESIVARRDMIAIEPGRTYLIRFAASRETVSTDLAGDAVVFGFAVYDRFGARLAGAPGDVVVESYTALTPGTGLVTKAVRIARAAGTGIDRDLPGADQVFILPYGRGFGSVSAVSHIEAIDVSDVTDAAAYSPDLTSLTGRVGSLESLNPGTRLTAVEAAIAGPKTLHFGTIALAQAATIGASVDYLAISGLFFRRAAAGQFQAGGAWWRIAPVVASQPTGPTLSATSGDAYPTLEVAAATNLYVVPAPTDLVGLYDGTLWIGHRIAQLTLPLNTSYGAATNYDVYLFLDGDTVRVGTIAWASSAAGTGTRGTGGVTGELELFEGRTVNKLAITLRNGASTYSVPARRGLLIGGFRTTDIGTTADSFTKRLVSNVFTVVEREMFRRDPTYEWAYSAAAFVLANNGNGNNRLGYFHVLSGRRIEVEVQDACFTNTTTDVAVMCGIGLNGTADIAQLREGATLNEPGVAVGTWAKWRGCPGAGYHELNWLEFGGGVAGTIQTWRGNSGIFASGIAATVPN